jgi:hypothetical protein
MYILPTLDRSEQGSRRAFLLKPVTLKSGWRLPAHVAGMEARALKHQGTGGATDAPWFFLNVTETKKLFSETLSIVTFAPLRIK